MVWPVVRQFCNNEIRPKCKSTSCTCRCWLDQPVYFCWPHHPVVLQDLLAPYDLHAPQTCVSFLIFFWWVTVQLFINDCNGSVVLLVHAIYRTTMQKRAEYKEQQQIPARLALYIFKMVKTIFPMKKMAKYPIELL